MEQGREAPVMMGESGSFWLVLSLVFWIGYCVSLYWMAYQVSRHTGKISFPYFSFFKTPLILETYKDWSKESTGSVGFAYFAFYASALLLIAAALMGILSL